MIKKIKVIDAEGKVHLMTKTEYKELINFLNRK